MMNAVKYLKKLGIATVLCSNFGCASGPQSNPISDIEPIAARVPQTLTARVGDYAVSFRCVAGNKIQADLLKNGERKESKVYGLDKFDERLKKDTRSLRYLGYWNKAENRHILEVARQAPALCNG